jgi:hypothetical protein
MLRAYGRAMALFALLLGSCARSADAARSAGGVTSGTRGARYALDGLSREGKRGACPKVQLGEFRGESLRFSPPARVTPAFRPRLVQLESIVREVALRVYGRAPTTLLVAASYACRTVNRHPHRLSEHALGNAIDISGFRFAPVPATGSHPAQDGFDVRIRQHWKAHSGSLERRHARFLDELTRTLMERDVFRTLLGPAHRDHKDHFHFDMAPGHYVDL